jgi:hypothetical protein
VEIPLLFGPYGSRALEHGEQFSACGANAAWFHGFDGTAFETCARHGIVPCVEFKTFRADFAEHPELVPIGIDGKPIRYGRLVQGVCLSNEAFLQETEEHLLEGVRAFKPVGIWFDYLTYGGWFETPEPDLQESCFCPHCVAEFCDATGLDANSPEHILAHHASAWTRHKCERIAGFAAYYASLVRRHLPDCVLGAYMCPWTPGEFDGALTRIFAQDYALLAPAIDVFTPLIYTTKSGRSAAWGRMFLQEAAGFVPPDRKVQLILDFLDFPDSLTETAASQLPTWGVQVFGGAAIFGDTENARSFHVAVTQIRDAIEARRD